MWNSDFEVKSHPYQTHQCLAINCKSSITTFIILIWSSVYLQLWCNPLEPLSHDDIVYIAEKLQNEAIKEDTLHKIATMLGFKEGLKEECFNNIDLSHIPFMLILEWERKMKEGGIKEKASKNVLARTIMEIANSMHKQSELLQTLARKLDMRG